MTDNKTYLAMYKCRLCGEVYAKGETGRDNAIRVMAHLATNTPMKPEMGNPMCMTDIHTCHDGNIGMSDFQGFVAVDRDELSDMISNARSEVGKDGSSTNQ